jgi:drug/metabolite transporter (DMT)-like permease
MEWYIFALLAPAFWAMNNVLIKFLITNKFKSYFPMIFTVVFMDAVFALAVSTFTPIVVSFPYSIVALIVGLMPLLAFWFYSKALIMEEVTRIITLFQLIPVFVVFLSVIFLNEVLGIQKYFGIFLIVIASMLISYKKSGEKPFSSALKFMIPFGVIIAAYTISDKILLGYLDYWSLFFWNVLGTFCGVLFLLSLPKLRKESAKTILAVGKKAVFTTFIGEGLYVIGTICSLVALSLVDASLASSLFGLQPFYVFFYTLLLSLFLPKILKEEISKSIISLKISAIALMFIGTWLVI